VPDRFTLSTPLPTCNHFRPIFAHNQRHDGLLLEPQDTAPRKIIHIDMDAFYAPVEQRDDPALCCKPVVVAWKGRGSDVCAAWWARTFVVGVCGEQFEVLLPHAPSGPTAEAHVRHTEIVEPLRQIAPWNPGSVAIQHRLHKRSAILRRTAYRTQPLRQRPFNPFLLIVS
jgi:hypothetical protein